MITIRELNLLGREAYSNHKKSTVALKQFHIEVEAYIVRYNFTTPQLELMLEDLDCLSAIVKSKYRRWWELYSYDNRITLYMSNYTNSLGYNVNKVISFFLGIEETTLTAKEFKTLIEVEGLRTDKQELRELRIEVKALRAKVAKIEDII